MDFSDECRYKANKIQCARMFRSIVSKIDYEYRPVLRITFVFSSYGGETRSREYASTGVVNSRYDCNNRHHE